VEFLDELRGSSQLNEDVELGAITKEELEGALTAKGRMDYIDYKPGRIEFLNKEIRSVEYSVKPLGDNSFQVFVESNKSKDAKTFETFLIKEVRREIGKDARLDTLDISLLSSKNTILFFDALATQAMETEWRFIDVKKIMFRRSDKEEEEEVEEKNLKGISRAILEGDDLRNNAFVKQSEKSGYKFTAMTYEYENKNHPYVIDVKAEFKFRPIVFEVGVTNYRKVKAPIEELIKTPLNSKEEIKMKMFIWQQAREIYKTLTSSEPPKSDPITAEE
jgi:hypothetical protein